MVRLKCCGAYLGADVVVQPALEKRTEGLPNGLDIPTTIKLMLKLCQPGLGLFLGTPNSHPLLLPLARSRVAAQIDNDRP